MDSGLDSKVDSGLDSKLDSTLDSKVDSGLDFKPDSGLDSRLDSGLDSKLRTHFGVRQADPKMGPPRTRRSICFGVGILENKKRPPNWGRLAAPFADIFYIGGPILGSARRTPKWGRRTCGDQNF